MRKEGDALIEHVELAVERVLLCAPFIKAGVLRRLIARLAKNVELEVVTRWHPNEIAVGVSDLEVFELIASRPRSRLRLLDNLHAKIYISDERLLAGSANLTATALGWCDNPNIELLTTIAIDDTNIQSCLASLSHARDATLEERDAVQLAADQIVAAKLPLSAPVIDRMASYWLPRLAAPENLVLAYHPQSRERMTSEALTAADHDLAALAVPPGLGRGEFVHEIGQRFCKMPAVAKILSATEQDLTDEAAVALVSQLSDHAEISPATAWRIIRDWLAVFASDRYEIAPQSFITRPKPGAGRR